MQWSRVKRTDHFSYPLVLDLYPYTVEAHAETNLSAAQEGGMEDSSAAVVPSSSNEQSTKETADGKKKEKTKKEDKELTEEEAQEAKRRKESKKQANKERKAQALFDLSGVNPKSPHLYYLFAVVIHSGKDAGYGHYHAYLRDVFHPQRVKAQKEKAAQGQQDKATESKDDN